MAASASAPNAASSDPQGPVPSNPAMDSPTIQYSMILEHLIGDKKSVKELNPTVMGLPSPPKSDEQKMIEKGMESCAFKTVLACVGGKSHRSVNIGCIKAKEIQVKSWWIKRLDLFRSGSAAHSTVNQITPVGGSNEALGVLY